MSTGIDFDPAIKYEAAVEAEEESKGD